MIIWQWWSGLCGALVSLPSLSHATLQKPIYVLIYIYIYIERERERERERDKSNEYRE